MLGNKNYGPARFTPPHISYPILTSSLLHNSIHLFPSSLLNALLCSILPSQTLSLLNHLHHSTSHLLLLILLSHSLTLIPCLQLKYIFLTTSSILYSISHSLN